MADKKISMQPEEFRLIKEFVAETFGLVLEEGKEFFLAAKLLPRLDELRLSCFGDYYAYLKFSPHSADEQRRMISIITNNETYFFREEAQLRVLVDEVLPQLREKKIRRGERSLRIVSAGCSSGEEVYSLAILLMESGSFVWDWKVELTGVDVDQQVIDKAVAGIYNPRAFQTTPSHIVDRYFTRFGDGFKIREVLRKYTAFMPGNLLQFDRLFDQGSVDIIFCRNVLIYFGEDTIKTIIANFSRVLVPDAFLFLGHSESLSRITSEYLPLRFPGAIIYKKRD